MNSQQLIALLPMILIFVVFYFVLIRPNQKQHKERMAMLARLKKGDKVVTVGGLHGSIVDLTDERVTLKVNDNTRLVFERSAINSLLSDEKGAAEEKKEKEKAKAAVKDEETKKAKDEAKANEQVDKKEEKEEKAEELVAESAGNEKNRPF
jgi:preprotein translocase subunit YajC